MNYLQIAQMTARESGTISGDATPSSVTGQSGRLLKVVNWTATAWQQVQNLREDWLWMRDVFQGPVTANTARYTSASWGLTRWGKWWTDDHSVTLYATAIGPADEGELRFMPWAEYRRFYDRGVPTPMRPRHYSISPIGQFCFGPVPDQAYVARGEYQKNAQLLAANTDIPELPDSALHSVIAWKALILLSQYDEGAWPTEVATVRCQDDLRAMQKYVPKPFVDFGGGASIA